MWLKRIEAERYGSLEDLSLGDLAPGLTVVLGPNEAGKSSLTALVRHILYGFPDRRSKERAYFSEGGARHGRLVFTDGSGEWAIERVEGRGSGDVSVRAIQGVDRPALHSELTRGVSAEAYRVAFGFGLGDMADVVGSSDDVVARLYAASAGISVSPHDVRRKLDSQKDELFKPSGRNPRINAAAREAGEIEKRLRALRHEAEALAEKRDRLAELSAQAATARNDVELAERRRDGVDAAVRDLERIEERLHALREELVEKRAALLHARKEAEETTVDARVLEAAPTIETLVEEGPAHRERAERAAQMRLRADGFARSTAERLAGVGVDEQAAAQVRSDADTRAGVEAWRDRLLRLELRCEESARAASAAANAMRAAADAGPAEAPAAAAAPVMAIAGYLLMALGAVGIVAGAITGAWLLVGFAMLIELVGVWMALTVWSGRRAAPDAAGWEREADVRRLSAEEARTAADARADAVELDAARAEWEEWSRDRGLHSAKTPAAAAEIVAAVCEVRRLQAEHDEALAAETAEVERLAEYLTRVRELAGVLGVDQPVDASEASTVVSGFRSMLAEAREQYGVRLKHAEEAAALEPRIEALESAEKDAEARALTIIEEHGFDGGLSQAQVYSAALLREAAEARTRFDEIDRERAMLAGEVSAMETESESSELALDLSAVREQISGLAERYVVADVAAALLERAQEVYERERQPQVMRDAGRTLATMTGGRYSSVTVPLGSAAVEVFDQAARARGTGQLSTGTAEQLYLSLRIALLSTLGEVGSGLPVLMDDVFANFDPERKRGAASAVAELASTRQVVVFTCHPETVEVLSEAQPGRAMLTLDRC